MNYLHWTWPIPLKRKVHGNLLSPHTPRPPGLVTQPARFFFLPFQKISRSVWCAALLPTCRRQRGCVPPLSYSCLIFLHTKLFQASPSLDGYQRPYGWLELNQDIPVTQLGEPLPLQPLQQDCLLSSSWKQQIGLPHRPSNAFITGNSLVVPLPGQC